VWGEESEGLGEMEGWTERQVIRAERCAAEARKISAATHTRGGRRVGQAVGVTGRRAGEESEGGEGGRDGGREGERERAGEIKRGGSGGCESEKEGHSFSLYEKNTLSLSMRKGEIEIRVELGS
jgi:hypothetical protein